MPRTASDRAGAAQAQARHPRPKCRSGRAVASYLETPAGGFLSPSDPIPTATGSAAAPAPKFSTASAHPARRLVASDHKSTAFSPPAAAHITLPALGLGFGAAPSEAMDKDQGNSAAAAAGGGARANRWEASLDGVIVLPAGSAAPRLPPPPPPHARQQRDWERARERENPGAGVFVGEHHGHAEPPEKVFYKTRLCEKFEAGKCAYEDGCNFAHGQAELRLPLPVPPALIIKRRTPPPSGADGAYGGGGGYYGKVCFEFRDKGSCHFGDRCAYAHASAAEVAEMRYPGGPRSVEHALRNAPPSARAALFMPAPSGGAPRGSSSSYAPAAARAFPSPPAAATGEDGRKLSRLELLSRKKTSGIYGDWPEED